MRVSFFNIKTRDSLEIYNIKGNKLWIGKDGGQDDGEGMEIEEQEFIEMLYAWYREKF